MDTTSPRALIINIKEMATFDHEFRAVISKTSFARPLLDVARWLMKRFVDNPDAVYGKSRELADQIKTKGYNSEFTEQAMVREVLRGIKQISSAPFASAKKAQGGETCRNRGATAGANAILNERRPTNGLC